MKCRTLVGAAFAAVLPFFGVAETYTLAGDDVSSPAGSAMNGTGSVGWTDSSGVTNKTHNPSAGNDYVVNQNYILRSPAGKSFAFGGDSLTVSGDSQIKDKGANNSTVTIPNLIVTGKATIANGDANALNKIAGAIDIREDGSLAFDVSFDNASGDARKFEVLADVSGAGSLCAVASMDVKTAGPYVKFLGSLAGFSGKVAVRGRGAVQFATIFASSLPGDPDGLTEDGLTVEGNSALKFETSGKLGIMRGVSLGSGACEIYVAEGETVQIDGFVTGSVGFRKTGKGTLALANVSPDLMGTVTVAEGTLQLCDVKETALPAADVTVAPGAVLDEHGPAVDHDPLVEATLTGVDVIADGQPHGPVLTVTDPVSGYQVEWSVDGGAYVPTRPMFTAPGVHTVFCRVSATGYMARKLRTTVAIRALRRIVATEAEKEGDWADATVAGDDAWSAIQGVIDACGVGDLVLVKAGTYLLTNELSFASSLPSGIILRSDDGEGHLARKTTLLVGGYPATSNRLVRISAPAAVVDGFTLTNGFVDASCGGGAYLDDCGAGGGLRNCDVVCCTAWHEPFVKSSINNSKLGTGGGVYVYNTGCVSNCLIRGNTAFAGGGVYLEGTRDRGDCSPDVIPRVTASTLVGNQVVGYGTDNAFTGSALASYRTALMDRCTVVSNLCNVTAKSQYSTAGSNTGYLYITDCVFESNHLGTWKATSISVIGANQTDRIVCVGTTFVREGTKGNVVMNNSGSVCDGNGMIDCIGPFGSWKEYRNCLFCGNTNTYCVSGFITAENCTFVNNKGAIYSDGSGAVGSRTNRVANCLFAGNVNDVYAGSEGNATHIALFVSNCCIRATSLERRAGSNCKFGILVTNGCNVVYDDGDWAKASKTLVRFADAGRGDYRLREGSQLVEAGMTLGWMDGARDRDGNPRIAGMVPDIGCYERQGYEIDPPLPCVRAVALEEDKTGVWTNAIVGLKAAVAAAGDDTPVYVKAGTYDVTEPIAARSWGVSIVGEGAASTVVDGGLPARTNRIFTIDTRNVTLEGLTIRNGKVVNANGGGVYVNATGFAMRNCVVDNCSAQDGGGLYAAVNCPCFGIVDTTFRNCWADRYGACANLADEAGLAGCTFRDSTAYTEGGGIYFGSKAFAVTDCVFTNCATSGNGANQKGGAIYGGGNVASVIERCQFLGCAAKEDGSAFYLNSPCTITDCLFANSCDTRTAWNSGSVIFSAKTQWIDSCIFRANVIQGSLCAKIFGGSVITNCVVENNPNVGKTPYLFTRQSGTDPVLVTDCVIRDTYANYIFDAGVNMEGCVFSNITLKTSVDSNDRGNVRNCLFTGCPSPILIQSPVFENCSFVGNVGGVVLNGTYSPAFTNCVFWSNSSPSGYYGSMGLAVAKNDFNATNRIAMANCVLQSNEETSPNAPDMRDADKTGATALLTAQAVAVGLDLMAAPGRGNAHSRAGSPIVDAGLVLDWMTEDAIDLDGKPRIVGMAPDVGCYERQGDEIDPPYPCTRAVAKAEDRTGVWADAIVGLPEAVEAAYMDEPLYVKAGTYSVTEQIKMGPRQGLIRIIGEGASTVVDGGYPARTNRIFTIDADDVTLSGLTIRNGWVSGKDQNGGGIYVNANGFTITNCVIDTCGAYNGGGLYWINNKTVGGGVLDCLVTNCTASNSGGGLYIRPEDFVMRQTTLAGCAATGQHGGGCFLETKGWTVFDSVFTNCTAQSQGGGVRAASGAIGAVTNTAFVTCGSKAGAPALYTDGGITMYRCRVVDSRQISGQLWGALKTAAPTLIDSCYFSRNQGHYGTAAQLAAGAVMTNCVFENQRRSVGYADRGVVTGSARYTIRNCLFKDVESNSVVDENGDVENCTFTNLCLTFMCGRSQNSFRNCLFTGATNVTRVGNCKFDNCSFVANFGGPALGSNSHSPAFTNCVFWANTPTTSGNCRGNMGLLVQSKDFDATNRIAMANCVFQTSEETSKEAPNMCDADKSGASTALTAVAVRRTPKFVDPANGNFRLRQNSPLRDKGLVLDWMTEEATDRDGKPRRISSDGKAYPDSLPDIGCYECDIPKPGFLLQVR